MKRLLNIALVLLAVSVSGAFASVALSKPSLPAIEPSLWDSLVSYWKLDEESGVRYDAFGDNDMTAYNTPGYGTGIINNSMRVVHANNEGLYHVDNEYLSVDGVDFTISAWVNFSDTSDIYGMIAKGNAPLGQQEYMLYFEPTTSDIRFYISSSGSVSSYISSDVLTPGQWFYVVAWHDLSSNEIGIQVNNSDVYTSTVPDSIIATDGVFWIGRYWGGGVLNGHIDEVGLWKRILSPAERCALYNDGAGLAFPFSNPVPSCNYIVHGDLGDVDLCDNLDDDTPWNTGNGATIANGEAAIPPGGVIWNTAWPAADTVSVDAKTTSWKQETLVLDWMGQSDNLGIYNNDTYHTSAIYLTNTGLTGTLTLAAPEANEDTVTVTEICRYTYAPVSPLPTPVSPLPTPSPQWDPWRPWQSQTDNDTISIVPRAGSDDDALCSNSGNILDNGDFEGGLWPWRCDWADYRYPLQSSIWDYYGFIMPNVVFSSTTSGYYAATVRTRSYNYNSIGGCPAFGQYVRGLVPGTYRLSYDVAIDGYGDSIPSSANVGGTIKRPGCVGTYCKSYSSGSTTSLMDKDVLDPDYLTYRITDTIVIPEYTMLADNLIDNGNFEYGTTAWAGEWNITNGGVEQWGHAAEIEYWMDGAYQDFAWPGGDMWVSVFSLSMADSKHTIKIENTGTDEYKLLCNQCIHNYGQESYTMWYDAQAGTYRVSLLVDTGTSHFDGVWVDSANSYSPPIDYFVGVENQHVQKPLGGIIPAFDFNSDEVSDMYFDNVQLCLDDEETFDKQLYKAPLAPMGIPTDEPATYFCPLYNDWTPISFFDDITATYQSGDPGGIWVIPTWVEIRKLYWFNSGQEYDINFRFGLPIRPDGGETSVAKLSIYTGTTTIVSSLFNVYQYMWAWPPPNITHVYMSIGANPSGWYWVSFYNTPSTWPQVNIIFDSLCFDQVFYPTATATPGGSTPTSTPTARPTLTGTPTPYDTSTPPPTPSRTPTKQPTRTPSPTGSTPTTTSTPPATNTPIPSPTGAPIPSNTPWPTSSPSSTPQPSTPTPQPTNTPGGTPTNTPTAEPTRTPMVVGTLPPGLTPTPLSLPPSYTCGDNISSITQWDRQSGVTLMEDSDYLYYARLNINEYVYRPFYISAGKHLLTYQARCNAYSSQSVIINMESRSPYGELYNQSSYQYVPCNVSGWIQALFEFSAPVGGAYTLYLTNIGGGTYYYDVDVRNPCLVIEGEPSTPTPSAGTGTPTPMGTSTPVPSGTPGATPTWGPAATATGGPGEPDGTYHYSPPEAGFCDAGAPDFPAYGGYCQESYAGNWWELPQLWLCLLWDLIQRLFVWLGRFLQWLLCPVFDVLYWIMCLVNTLASIASNLFCWVSHQWDFIVGLWNGFWS